MSLEAWKIKEHYGLAFQELAAGQLVIWEVLHKASKWSNLLNSASQSPRNQEWF